MKYFPCCTLQTEEFVAIQSALRQCTDVARIWEGTVEGESLRIYFGFSIFFLKHLLLTFQKLAKHLHKDKRGWAATKESKSDLHFAEVCTNFRPKWFLLKKGKMSYFFSFLLKFPDIILRIAKTIGPPSSAEELLSTVFESVFNATASMEPHLTTPGECSTWCLCSVKVFWHWFTVQTDFLFCLDHCMHSKDNENESTQ